MGFLDSFFKKTDKQLNTATDANQNITQLLNKVEKLEGKIEQLQAEKLNYELKINGFDWKITQYENQVKDLQSENTNLQKKLIEKDNVINTLNLKISEIESSCREIGECAQEGSPEIIDVAPLESEKNISLKDHNLSDNSSNKIDGVIIDKSNKPFLDALDIIENSNESLFLTGKAGTGKTTFLKYLTSKLKKKFIVLAPTGVAAVNAGGVTLHSFFQLSFSPYLPDDSRLIRDNLKLDKNRFDIIKNVETIIIDEISMVRCDTIDAISQILKTLRHNNKPFGGVQMVFIGDLFQLSPIADARFWDFLGDFYDTEFFFNAFAFKESKFKYIELDKIYRQNDLKFIELLNRVRENNITNTDLQLLNSRLQNVTNYSMDGYITLSTHRKDADSLNATKLAKINKELVSFNAIIQGLFDEKDAPADTLLSLKVGAQVMLIKNNLPDYYNGSMGIIESIDEEHSINENGDEAVDDVIYIRLFSNNEVVRVTRAVWENQKYTYNREKKRIEPEVIGTFTQFPVKLAWAITIHKSQGLTFDKAIIDAGKAFTHGQTYVALSRCRSLEGMLLKTRIDPKAIIVNTEVSQFIKEMNGEQSNSYNFYNSDDEIPF
ncbi:AAA family ATPase [Glaesserella parasuis]|nr:AAA family ATPase [Glaesserella parasuis]